MNSISVKEIDLSDILSSSAPIINSAPVNSFQTTSSSLNNVNSARTIPIEGLDLLSNRSQAQVKIQPQQSSSTLSGNFSFTPQTVATPALSSFSGQNITLQRNPQEYVSSGGAAGNGGFRDLSDMLNSDSTKMNSFPKPVSPLLNPTIEVSKSNFDVPQMQQHQQQQTFQTFPQQTQTFQQSYQQTTQASSLVPINATNGSGFGGGGSGQPSTALSASATAPPVLTEDDIQKEKQDILFKLQRLAQKGVPITRKYTMNHSLAEIKDEYLRLKGQRDLDMSVKFQKKMLMAFSTGVEFLNSKFDPFDIKLDGWSESMHESIDEYDDIFEELHEKYKERANIAPEMKLAMSVVSSAFMYHMMQSFFKSSFPGMEHVMRENPDLARQVGQAAVNSAAANAAASNSAASSGGMNSPGIANFMSSIFGGMGTSGGGGGMKTTTNSDRSVNSNEGFRGPTGVDHILEKLDRRPQEKGIGSANVNLNTSSSSEGVRNIEVQRRTTKVPSFNKGIPLNL